MHREERFGMLRRAIAFAMSLVLVVGGLPTSAMAEGLAGGAVAATSASTTQGADAQGGADASQGDGAATSDVPDAAGSIVATDSEVAMASETTSSDDPAASAATTPTDVGTTTVASDSQTIAVKASVLVPATADGTFTAWAAEGSYKVASGTTADVLTEQVLKAKGLKHESSTSSDWGYLLSSITSGNTTLANESMAPYHYWQLFENGRSSDLGASSVHLSAGDTISWVYSTYGETLPANPVTVNPGSSHEDVGSDWPGFKGGDQSGVVSGLATPTTTTDLSWAAKLKKSGDWTTSVSDPVIVGGDVWVAAGDKLLILSSDTGAVKRTVSLVSKIDSIARMVYADGLVVVPLSGGRLQAVSAQTHETVWATDTLAKTGQTDQQSLATLVVDGGKVFMGTAAASWSASYGGHLICVELATGSLLWDKANDRTGYYWSGAAIRGGVGLIADDSGTLTSFSTKTGETIKTASLGTSTSVRSSVVMAADGIHAFVMSKDGTLYRVAMAADGSFVEEASVSLGSSSTSTPVLVGDKLIVGGSSKSGEANKWGGMSYYGALFVVDAQTLEVEATIDTAISGFCFIIETNPAEGICSRAQSVTASAETGYPMFRSAPASPKLEPRVNTFTTASFPFEAIR